MAWRCSGRTNAELIANMTKNSLISSDLVSAAMSKTDRANYVLDKADAYQDSPQTIKYGATISAPHMHAHATENLLNYLHPGAKVLDVGSGSGYLCGIFHRLVSPDNNVSTEKGKVVGIDHIPQLVEWSTTNLCKDGLGLALDNKEIEMIAGDGRLGYPEGGPYHAIHVGAAAPTVPAALLEQLARPGRMFIPVGEHEQDVIQIDKDHDGKITQKTLFGVRYVPLTDRQKQWRDES